MMMLKLYMGWLFMTQRPSNADTEFDDTTSLASILATEDDAEFEYFQPVDSNYPDKTKQRIR